MSNLTEEEAKKLLNLKSHDFIDEDIAERQFQVILKGFNYLNQEGNDFLYIADEVGLGKTYIALGIASLLRYFSDNKTLETYKDTIILPKKNLQYKWQKEIKNFIRNNWLVEKNRVKSILREPVGKEKLYNKLEVNNQKSASYELIRMSSFSLSLQKTGWRAKLRKRLTGDELNDFKKASNKLKGNKHKETLKRLFAYLVNLKWSNSNLVIVDEAHNYRHGIDTEASTRNQVLSRIMGVKNDEIDKEIFRILPNLQAKIEHKANKVILLSATPLNKGCYEIKNQLDVFLPEHKYRQYSNEEKVKEDLQSFMIRGLMEVKLNNKKYSRNQYRHEHRKGNVNHKENANHQTIDNPFTQAVMSLMQLKTIEKLQSKGYGGQFEMGMLAGFEDFDISDEKGNDLEESNSRKSKRGEDEDIISEIAKSYKKNFKEQLKHPKLEKIVEMLFQKMKKQEKSLVFVRRIKTIDGIVRKLTDMYENEIAKKKCLIKLNYIEGVRILINEFEERTNRTLYLRYLKLITERITKEHYVETWKNKCDENALISFDDDDGYERVNNYVQRKILKILTDKTISEEVKRLNLDIKEKMKYKRADKSIVEQTWALLSNEEINDFSIPIIIEKDENSSEQRYFFLDYFSTRYPKGKAFRSLISTKDWYRFNYYYLLQGLKIGIDDKIFNDNIVEPIIKTKSSHLDSNKQDYRNQFLLNTIASKGNLNDVPKEYKNKTFLTSLLTDILKKEWNKWLSGNRKSNLDKCLSDLEDLTQILQGIFRNGLGLLPSYIAYLVSQERKTDFNLEFRKLLEEEFRDVLNEVRTVLLDFDNIMATNFPNKSKISTSLYQQAPVLGASSQHNSGGISKVALQFRMPGFPYVLVSTSVLKEGEDLHSYCSDIYHYGVAWNPSEMEQRTGRIDRINSKTYQRLTKDKEQKINFDNSLHIYYPYLSDTLEVNQMHKLFSQMNNFVETFNDVSMVTKNESKASINSEVLQMPEQNKEFLTSTFEHTNFKGHTGSGSMEMPKHVGTEKTELLSVLENLFNQLQQEEQYQYPQMNKFKMNIEGVLRLSSNNRRGPYELGFVATDKLGVFQFLFESKISSQLDSKKFKQIEDELENSKYVLYRKNRAVWLTTTCKLDSKVNLQFKKLKDLIIEADRLEEKYTTIDEE